jgi:hypothetical protein
MHRYPTITMAHKNHYKKILVVAAALVVIFAPIATAHIAFAADAASTPGVVNWFTSPVTSAVYYVSLTVDKIMTLAVVGTAALVRLGLQFNEYIFTSPEVTTGFSVSLAIANLGFVLGIIIIAIATILRNQTYGIKQLLWKLVFMAILVNFGLVIMAPIVGFADSMSNYFINATSPSSATGGYEGYVTTMAQAFAPQTMTPANSVTSASCSGAASGTGTAALCNLQTNVGNATQAGSPDSLTQEILSMVFGITFLGLTAFTFLCLAILLIIRYLMLAGLLILLPLAWLTYVFPKFDNSFSKWWNVFIKWTFFPPLALFFIYLAFTTAANTGGLATQNAYLQKAAGLPAGASSGPEGALVYQTGLGGAIQQGADEILLVGLTIMGLLFALSLSGKAGSTVVNGATSVSKAAAGYAGRKTGKGAARLYQKAGGRDLNAALQRSRIPFVSTIGRGAANLTESATKNQVDARHKALGLGAMDDDRLQAVTQGLHGKEDQIAAAQEWQKRGKVDKIEKIGGVSLAEWLSKNQQPLKDYGRGKLSGEIDTAMGSNDKIRRIAKVTGAARATVSTDEIEKITNSAQVVDKNGIMGTVGVTVSAKDLTKAAKNDPAFVAAQAVLDDPDSSKDEKKKARPIVKHFQDPANDADAAIADAINKRVDDVDVEDKENLLGHGVGKTAKAGEFRASMQKESETFWAGKDKGDASKMKSSAIFGNEPKFGLDKEALNEIGKSVAHGIVTQVPGAMGSIAGKLDNSKQLETFTSIYRTGIEDAKKSGKINETRARDLNDALKKVLAGKLSYMGTGMDTGDKEEPTPTQPVPPPKP